MFGVAIPGRPMQTNLQQVSEKNAIMEIPQPAIVRELCVTLLQPALPPDHGVAVYWALPPFSDWLYVGQISPAEPTAIFRAPWYHQIPHDVPILRLGLSIETTGFLANLRDVGGEEEKKSLDSAQGIAKDLYNFMASFTRQSSAPFQQLGDVLVIPTNCIDKWYEKFLAKHKLNPYFWMKK